MALALIDFIEFDKNQARFIIDTGTNQFYKLKIGKTKTEKSGIKWVDEIIHTTSLKRINETAYLLNTDKEITIPANFFDSNGKYVQLFSFKNETGKSPAFSKIVTMPANLLGNRKEEFLSMSNSVKNDSMAYQQLNDCRYISGVNSPYAYQTGFEEILGKIIQVATPIINNFLASNQNSQGSHNASTQSPPIGLLNTILNSLLNGFGTMQNNNISKPQSIFESEINENRFAKNDQLQFAQPFIAFAALLPILAPIIQAVAPQIIQAVPQLLQAQNDSKLKLRQENNNLTKDILSDVNKRVMLLQILQHLPQNTSTGNTDVNQLIQMIQQMPESLNTPSTSPIVATTAPGSLPAIAPIASVPQISIGKSLMDGINHSIILSSSTIINFEHAKKITWNGLEKNLYSYGSNIKLFLKLVVAGNIPKNALPKSILKICFKDNKTSKNYTEKTIKQKNILPNALFEFSFTKSELSTIPPNAAISVYGEMRWKTKTGKEIKALGTSEIIFTTQYIIKETGKPVSEERELKDMRVYKSFWNKIWESPVLDAANQKYSDKKKYRWSLDSNGKYFYSLSAQHDSNGVSDTQFLIEKKDNESLTEKTEGRLKSGMELSILELNKLCTLWENQNILPPEKLQAFTNDFFAESNSSEFIFNFKLAGSIKEHGMIWVVPVFKLFEFTLSKTNGINENGQIIETEEEKVQFPLPVASRILALKSE